VSGTNKFVFRLSNTTKSLDQLMRDSHAILLENALIDSSRPLNLSIPKNLLSQGDPGAYIVQARGPIDNAFRAMLARSGAEIVSYIPNDAYLVRAPASVANGLTGNPLTQAVIPFEPYYKISSSMSVTVGQRTLSSAPMKTNRAAGPSLLALAVKQSPLPAGTCLTLGLFKDNAAATVAQIEKLGGRIFARDNSPFGPVVRVRPPADWVALAALPGVQIVEPYHQRIHANDLSRATVGVAADTQVPTNYMNLSGSNVLVEVNDSGIDWLHPDFWAGDTFDRVIGDSALSLVDTNGHGTHVAGTIAGNGSMSLTVTNAQGSIMPGANLQFRGMAPLAYLYSVAAINDTFSYLNVSDQYLQQAPALNNALISNNSWNYNGDNAYDLAAASYDAAVRDALPEVTGSQPVLFVFSAGDSGGGDDNGDGGNSDTIQSPATAKNVITVGALEQLRGITNVVTRVVNGVTNPSTPWRLMTDTDSQVAGYSSCGNVGVGTEGANGRLKPDVVAPGSSVISTRSEQWDEQAYYNPTNYYFDQFSDLVDANSLNAYFISLAFIPPNTVFNSNIVAVSIQVVPNMYSTLPFPNFEIFVSHTGTPNPTIPSTYDFVTMNNQVSIPPDGGSSYLTGIQEGNLYYAVVNTNNVQVNYDIITEIVATNQNGDYFQVLSNLNNSLGGSPDSMVTPHYYRYESGTSMAAADVSGVLALMQDYFTNKLHATPSPALLKALLINGARLEDGYTYDVQNTLNDRGWGLINLPDSLPAGITTNVNNSAGESMLMIDQSPANALATGDNHTYSVTIPDGSDGQLLPLRVTLTWTDPPGDPAAAIKLVNSLELVVTNLSDPANPIIFYGNDIAGIYNTPEGTNAPNYDSINNVQNVFIQMPLGTQYSVTVIGRSVNVNAVTAQTNTYAINGPPGTYAPNVVQDYALVISCGEGEVTNAFKVTDVGPGLGIVSKPTSDQQITYVVSPDAPYLNQLAGASTPLLGTNNVTIGTISGLDTNNNPVAITDFATNAILTLGMMNQWHFYVVTNTGAGADFTNAAFITFDPDTLSIPRMGVFANPAGNNAGPYGNVTRPEADIDLYVSSDPTLTNLNPVAISNCVHGTQIGLSAAGVFNGASLSRGGTEFVVDINSVSVAKKPGAPSVYYVGVYSEDQQAAQYGFIPIFTDIPFSQMNNSNGTQIVNGLVLPANIPDGSTKHPGVQYIFALAIYPMEIQRVVVTDLIAHQHLGDLIGGLKHGGQNGLSATVVLNNHDAPFNPPSTVLITNMFVYDDSGQNNIIGTQPSDGPGSLNRYVGQQGIGPWMLTEVDDSLTQTGAVAGFNLLIEPHQDATKGVYGTVGPLGWKRDYVDVPPGTASLTISATNLTGTGQLDLYVKFGAIPTLTDTNEYGPAGLTNSGLPGPGNSITINSPAPGLYWWGLYNNSVQQQNFYLIATLGLVTPPAQVIYTSAGPAPIPDDAVTTDSIYVTADQPISSVDVALRVDHPRISDLVFHLISPDGTRVLLVENRGGNTANMGATTTITNVVPVSSSGGAGAATNIINVAMDTGTLSIYYNFYSIPDRMVVYDQSGALIFDSGLVSGSGAFNVSYVNSSFLKIVMNPGGGETGTGWDYELSAMQARQTYLVLTETNHTTTPIKFAPPPFVPGIPALATSLPEWHSSFEPGGLPDGGWIVDFGSVDSYTNGSVGQTADEGSWMVDLDGSSAGGISTNIATVAGQAYTLSFTYARNPDSIAGAMGNPPHVPQANVLIDGNTNATVVANYTNSWANLDWQTTSIVFTATASLTHLAFASLDNPSSVSGVLLDCLDLTPSALNDGFENTVAGDYVAGVNPGFGGWAVTANQVTVISNSVLANTGAKLLALADGQISRILPTIPGATYTLSYAYRGPGAVALWRAESNTLNSIDGITPTSAGIAYTNGQVGRAFQFNGSTSLITEPPSAGLAVSNLTIDAWVYPTNLNTPCPVVEYGGDGLLAPIFLWINTTGLRTANPGALYAVIRIQNNAGYIEIKNPAPVVTVNKWNHLALTVNATTLTGILYCNGVQVNSAISMPVGSPVNPLSFAPVNIGYRDVNGLDIMAGQRFLGNLDEVSIYNRALSASEILAIYNQGTNHLTKYNINAPAGIAQGLAEAQVTLNGTNQPIFFGNDTNWQTATYSFTATQTNTPLQITGLEPGMLLDSFVLTTIPTNNYDLYYQPEESLDLLAGEDALGQWTLEIQDDRAGAVGTNVSWQLRFNFPYTPPTITTLTNGQVWDSNSVPPNTMIIPPGGIAYYLVLVPTSADIATNILLYAPSPVNLWFDFASPPTGILPNDVLILTNSTGGTSIVYGNLYPNFVQPTFAGGPSSYYLGVQNTNSFAITNYGIQVNFHLVPPPLSLPPLPELLAVTNQLFTVTNAATGGTPPLTYTLTSSVPGANVPVIDANGAITWTPTTSQAPAVYTLTNIVYDVSSPVQRATNIFHVLVVLTNGLPAFPGAEGAGGFAIGGRGGDVYHVVNLNDSGPGSLRNGILSTFGSRTIVFDVSGTINLYSPLQINNPYFTIAGQTAPGAGITIQGLTTSVENTHDAVVRFLRSRPGDIYAQYYQGDSFHFLGVTNSIADHISASWSLDTVLSTTYATNITVQWSMIAQPLNHSAYLMGNGNNCPVCPRNAGYHAGYQEHGYGSLIRDGSGAVSYLHNLYADNDSYNPRVGDNIRLDFINNVVCNWGEAAGLNEDDATNNPGGYTNYLNYRGNYFIAGHNSTNDPGIAFASGVPNAGFTQIYEATNLIDTNAFNLVLDGTNTDWGMFSGNFTELGSPTLITNGISVATNSPAFAYEQVLAFAGASVAGATAAGSPASGTSLLRDPVDTNIVANVRNKSGQIIDFISSNSFAGVYLSTNFGVAYSGYTNAAVYWVAQGFTNFVGVNPWPVLDSAPQPLDSDGDGLPDYWEITLKATGEASMDPAVPNNNHSNPDGYTDLEHYLNWLAAPHALTVSNTPVDVDLYAVVGRTGNLSFGVTPGTNGVVTLGTNGYTATFMPSNNYFGFASFGFTVTNLATTNGFGPVTVSVMVSITNIVTTSLPLTNAVPQTNTVPAGGIAYFLIDVPGYAQLATNILSATTGPLNLLFSRVGFPTGTNTGDYFLLTNTLVGGSSILGVTTNFMPTNIIPGGTYYLGVQNPGVVPVTFGLEVDFYPSAPIPPPPPPPPGPPVVITITSITHTNGGYLLQWQGPTNYQYAIQWTTNLAPVVWNTVLNPVINVVVTSTNGHFNWFDDGTLTGGFGPMKFYRILGYPYLGPITSPGPATNTILPGGMSQAVVTVPANAIAASNFLIAASGPLNVWFNQTNSPTGNTNAGDFLMLSATSAGVFVLTGSSVPPLVPGTNYYLGFQNPGTSNVTFVFQVAFGFAPTNAVSNFSVTATNGGVWLKWNGLTNYQYQVQWTTNLAPPVAWNTISNIVLTSATGIFTFFDDGSLTGGFGPMKFYRLIAWPFMTPIPQTLSISSVTVTNITGTNDLVLRWSAPTNYQYKILWTTNLALPFSSWSLIASPVPTPANGVYTFIDNGQTGPPASTKFFRLYEYP
jgi:subtilisin-like proprotein convertase family protein